MRNYAAFRFVMLETETAIQWKFEDCHVQEQSINNQPLYESSATLYTTRLWGGEVEEVGQIGERENIKVGRIS